MSDRFGSLTMDSTRSSVCEYTYINPVSGSYEPPGQFAPFGTYSVPILPSYPLVIGGVKSGPILYCETIFSASALIAGVKSITSSMRKPCRSKGGGLVGNGCVGEYHSVGTAPTSTGRSSIGHTGWPVCWSNTYTKPCLVGCAIALIRRPPTVMSARIGAQGMS